MDREQLEFRISQYVDGTLPAAEVAALEATLASDADARAMLADFRSLDAQLKHQAPLPAINWDRLAVHLCDAVAQEDEATEKSQSIPIRAWWRPIAIAASVLIVIGTVLLLPRHTGTQVATTPHQAAPITLVELAGPEVSNRPPVVEVSMVSSAAPAQQANYRLAEDIIYRAPRVVIASADSDRQDSGSRLPY